MSLIGGADDSGTWETMVMRKADQRMGSRLWMLVTALSLTCATFSGCQSDIGGQTLPSPYYLYDDIQYFPAGPEFPLTAEAAAMKAARAERTLQGK